MNTRTLLAAGLLFAMALPPCGAQMAQTPVAVPAATPIAPIANQITINVLGQVNRPDRIVLPIGSGLLDAIAAAGGFTRIGNPANVIVIHKTSGERPDVSKIDMKKIMNGYVRDVRLRDGDTVEIGEVIF